VARPVALFRSNHRCGYSVPVQRDGGIARTEISQQQQRSASQHQALSRPSNTVTSLGLTVAQDPARPRLNVNACGLLHLRLSRSASLKPDEWLRAGILPPAQLTLSGAATRRAAPNSRNFQQQTPQWQDHRPVLTVAAGATAQRFTGSAPAPSMPSTQSPSPATLQWCRPARALA